MRKREFAVMREQFGVYGMIGLAHHLLARHTRVGGSGCDEFADHDDGEAVLLVA
jgi:hypothetical protein